ncbi:REP-associated tyrosine transposase [Mesobacterium pallidum]|uniref:REP-associated tyrosine transposase n=1 Tax=Mesobacterium pallidum TaxID=2872037 RepID=UPI001EE223EE|nr:transposase [Mesobacterium pallidum]
MSRYLRPRVTGATIFFTVALQDRRSALLVDEIDALRNAVRQTREERPFEIDAWVVLPDHLHCIWRLPVGDRDYGRRWGAIKARFTRTVRGRVGFDPTCGEDGTVGWNPTLRSRSKVRKGEVGLWQRRFWEHHIRDEADHAAHLRYCWLNPVKHGLVARAEEWPFSSIHRDPRFRADMDMTM